MGSDPTSFSSIDKFTCRFDGSLALYKNEQGNDSVT